MANPEYVRAEYDEERCSYISCEADWIDCEPSAEYRFLAQEDEDKPGSWEGSLEKFWCDEDENWNKEYFIFGEYLSEADFDADVERILREAKGVVAKENIDEFLAVTDIVKRRTVQVGYAAVYRFCDADKINSRTVTRNPPSHH